MEGERYPIIKSQPIPNDYVWDTNAFEAEKMIIYLTDLGHGQCLSCAYLQLSSLMDPTAQRAGEQPTANYFGALGLRAPETTLQSDFGSAVDIWSVGCIVRWLFPVYVCFANDRTLDL